MKRGFAVGAVVIAFSVGATARAQDAVAKGKQVYDAATPKCKVCHSVGGEGNAKGPLENSAKLSAADLKAWMRTPKEMSEKAKATRKPAMPAYPVAKLSDADLDALVAYIQSLKK
jgi:mono/diheme cytochrome c family protein